jgi:hypothetical protein
MTTTAGDPVLELEYPRAFADAIAPSIASGGKRFRYLHLSGAMVERDQKKPLWMKANVRKIKVCVTEILLGPIATTCTPMESRSGDCRLR